MQSLIEQVKRLAEAHREHGGARTRDPNGPHSIGVEIDATSLLAHLERMQAVVDAALEWVETPRFRVDVARGDITPKGLALVAALENLENTDGK